MSWLSSNNLTASEECAKCKPISNYIIYYTLYKRQTRQRDDRSETWHKHTIPTHLYIYIYQSTESTLHRCRDERLQINWQGSRFTLAYIILYIQRSYRVCRYIRKEAKGSRRDGGDWLRGALFNMLSRTHDLHSSFPSPRRACKALRIFCFMGEKKKGL